MGKRIVLFIILSLICRTAMPSGQSEKQEYKEWGQELERKGQKDVDEELARRKKEENRRIKVFEQKAKMDKVNKGRNIRAIMNLVNDQVPNARSSNQDLFIWLNFSNANVPWIYDHQKEFIKFYRKEFPESESNFVPSKGTPEDYQRSYRSFYTRKLTDDFLGDHCNKRHPTFSRIECFEHWYLVFEKKASMNQLRDWVSKPGAFPKELEIWDKKDADEFIQRLNERETKKPL